MNTKKSILIIFVFLLGITLLLLELPRQYYKLQDQKLLEERGTAKYDTKITKTVNDFSSKLDSFLSYDPYSSTNGIGYTKELTNSETIEVFEKLIQEFETMTDGGPEKVIDVMKSSSTKSQCFTAQVFQLLNNEQFIWEVGNLEFSLTSLDIQGRIIYDTDTYKIIMICWYCSNSETAIALLLKPIEYAPVYDYYSAYAEDICFGQEAEFLITHPFPVSIYDLEETSLLKDLNELSEYFWPEDMIQYMSIATDSDFIQE